MDDAIAEYIENSAIYPLWVAKKDKEVLGFINLKEAAVLYLSQITTNII